MPAAAKRTTTTDLRAAAIAWRHAQDALQADALEPWEHGTVLRTPSAPSYYDVNAVRVQHGSPDGPALEAAVDALLAGFGHRKLSVEDEALGAAVRPHFQARGWSCERLAVMYREGRPEAPGDAQAAHPTPGRAPERGDAQAAHPAPGRAPERGGLAARVLEVPLADTRPLRVRWNLEYDTDAAAQERFAALQEPILLCHGTRAFLVPDTGFALFAAPPGADAVELEQLYVVPEARGRGIGAALTVTGLAACGRPRAWVVADDEGRARSLYERLGFATVWREHAFLRAPA